MTHIPKTNSKVIDLRTALNYNSNANKTQ